MEERRSIQILLFSSLILFRECSSDKKFAISKTAESGKLNSHAASRPLSRVSSTRMKTGRGGFSGRSLTFAGRAPIKSTNRNESYNTGGVGFCKRQKKAKSRGQFLWMAGGMCRKMLIRDLFIYRDTLMAVKGSC